MFTFTTGICLANGEELISNSPRARYYQSRRAFFPGSIKSFPGFSQSAKTTYHVTRCSPVLNTMSLPSAFAPFMDRESERRAVAAVAEPKKPLFPAIQERVYKSQEGMLKGDSYRSSLHVITSHLSQILSQRSRSPTISRSQTRPNISPSRDKRGGRCSRPFVHVRRRSAERKNLTR